jgi:hypothetical protein
MQVFRLVETGKPDKLIAFDELPKRLLEGVEMRSPDGLPRHWKSFLGEHEKYTPGALEKNQFTGKVEKIGEAREKGPYFFVLYFKEINKDKDRWQEICSFVRRVVHLQFRLLDKIEDMAIPMAIDSASELNVEPEHLEEGGAIIPIPPEHQEKDGIILPAGAAPMQFKCEACNKEFKNKHGMEIHNYRVHPKKEAVEA